MTRRRAYEGGAASAQQRWVLRPPPPLLPPLFGILDPRTQACHQLWEAARLDMREKQKTKRPLVEVLTVRLMAGVFVCLQLGGFSWLGTAVLLSTTGKEFTPADPLSAPLPSAGGGLHQKQMKISMRLFSGETEFSFLNTKRVNPLLACNSSKIPKKRK